ncbi:sensor histidine kinase [Deinococcus sp. SDU3-2]|uniref:Sensor histidine kinase n=1 Tax=Deinococcus terrestris TaxID=2651870 RepID=A0A7X1NXS0_9DEIO|nr:sensor histidine kinase [Deinococcus terrestris]MPY67459.1 sensor histidine kinase [Deinococcus terrestris]
MTRPAPRRTLVWDLFPMFWLAFLAFPVAGFLERPRTWSETALFVGLLALFLAVYLNVFRFRVPTGRSAGVQERWAVAGWVLSLVTYFVLFPLTSGTGSAFLIYGASMIGFQARTALALWLAFLNAAVMVWPFWTGTYQPDDLWWLAPNLLFTLVAAYANHASYGQRIARAQLEVVQREKERLAADAERERIARDLHDLLGHTLSVIVLKSELAGKLAERDPVRAAQEIREVERISREALTEVRDAVHGYRGSGLNAELARAKVALDAAGVRLSVTGPLPDLPAPTEAGAAMLLREAVTNVVRHAHAREVEVTLTRTKGGHRLVIRDDGVGGEGPEGSGLTGMRERLRALGGQLTRDGTGGTTLTADFPDDVGGEGTGAGLVTA